MKAYKIQKMYKNNNTSLMLNHAISGNGNNFVYCPEMVLIAYHLKHTYMIPLIIMSYRLKNSRFYGRFIGAGYIINDFSFNGLYGR